MPPSERRVPCLRHLCRESNFCLAGLAGRSRPAFCCSLSVLPFSCLPVHRQHRHKTTQTDRRQSRRSALWLCLRPLLTRRLRRLSRSQPRPANARAGHRLLRPLGTSRAARSAAAWTNAATGHSLRLMWKAMDMQATARCSGGSSVLSCLFVLAATTAPFGITPTLNGCMAPLRPSQIGRCSE